MVLLSKLTSLNLLGIGISKKNVKKKIAHFQTQTWGRACAFIRIFTVFFTLTLTTLFADSAEDKLMIFQL